MEIFHCHLLQNSLYYDKHIYIHMVPTLSYAIITFTIKVLITAFVTPYSLTTLSPSYLIKKKPRKIEAEFVEGTLLCPYVRSNNLS